jgi:hypothetical protein
MKKKKKKQDAEHSGLFMGEVGKIRICLYMRKTYRENTQEARKQWL